LTDAIIAVENVKKLYRTAGEELWALKGISLQVMRGEFLAVMGPSGSGKSTFFNQLGALDIPTEGKVFFEGRSLFELSEQEQAWVRCRKIGYIFQTYNLIAVMSARQNVMLPITLLGVPRDQAWERAAVALEKVGLGHRLDHRPGELSGGQQQRVAIARAIANNPAVILADEPTGNLDSKTGTEVVALLKQLNKEQGVTVICSTHDEKVLRASERVCWIRDGRLERLAAHAEIDSHGLGSSQAF
jgi:putative ABC transport system ATP-binding protein